MKKQILLILSILLLSGCFEDSGVLTTTCTKEENANTLSSKTVYEIISKKDDIERIEVTYTYKDNTKNTISSIKTSINSSDNYIKGLNKKILLDANDEFRVSYIISKDSNDEVKNKFDFKNKRSDLVKILKEKGFSCN